MSRYYSTRDAYHAAYAEPSSECYTVYPSLNQDQSATEHYEEFYGIEPDPYAAAYADPIPVQNLVQLPRGRRLYSTHTSTNAESRAPLPTPPHTSPPRAPKARRDLRSVTPPPRRDPSPSYLSAIETPSVSLSDPAVLRKLLILDLNGTLVFRSPRAQRYGQPPARDKNGRTLPRLRTVHPRPYMPTFRNYLFHSDTARWLDVMIWSSAQPHSVDDMASRCFGDARKHLIAVWARDTLGLSEDHYNRKVQTIKDLAKPWARLPSLQRETQLNSTSHEHTPRTAPSSPSSSPPPPSSSPSRESHNACPQTHSAQTTLLLDDSPRKAELQPYNHVCISEYAAALRAGDLARLTADHEREARAFTAQHEPPQTEGSHESIDGGSVVDGVDSSNLVGADPPTLESPGESSTKRKRRKRTHSISLPTPLEAGEYDDTLLAVIGVLDAVSQQSNVAGWIRAGGLWGPEGIQSTKARRVMGDGQSDMNPRKRRRSQDAEILAGNDEDTVASVAADGPSEKKSDDDRESAEELPVWFDHPETRQYWVGRGREVAERLGIAIEHGIER